MCPPRHITPPRRPRRSVELCLSRARVELVHHEKSRSDQSDDLKGILTRFDWLLLGVPPPPKLATFPLVQPVVARRGAAAAAAAAARRGSSSSSGETHTVAEALFSGWLACLPAGHGLHCACPDDATQPPPHVVHCKAPSGAKVPGGQEAQLVLSSEDTEPAWHVVHFAEPNGAT